MLKKFLKKLLFLAIIFLVPFSWAAYYLLGWDETIIIWTALLAIIYGFWETRISFKLLRKKRKRVPRLALSEFIFWIFIFLLVVSGLSIGDFYFQVGDTEIYAPSLWYTFAWLAIIVRKVIFFFYSHNLFLLKPVRFYYWLKKNQKKVLVHCLIFVLILSNLIWWIKYDLGRYDEDKIDGIIASSIETFLQPSTYDWETYYHPEYGVSFGYPSNLSDFALRELDFFYENDWFDVDISVYRRKSQELFLPFDENCFQARRNSKPVVICQEDKTAIVRFTHNDLEFEIYFSNSGKYFGKKPIYNYEEDPFYSSKDYLTFPELQVLLKTLEINPPFYLDYDYLTFEDSNVSSLNKENKLILYFPNKNYNRREVYCQAVYPVIRELSNGSKNISNILNLLIEGPLEEEKEGGFYSVLPIVDTTQSLIEDQDNFQIIKDYTFSGNTAYISINDWVDDVFKEKGCRLQLFLTQIEETLKQFSEIKEISFSLVGP